MERRPHRRSFVRQIAAALRSRLPRKIKAPLLVLGSRADRLVSWKCSERIARALGAELELHDEGGHDLVLDAGPWICARLRAWSAR